MVMRSVRIQPVPSSVVNRNLSLASLTKLLKDVCLDFRKKTAVSVFEFGLQRKKLREREEILEREGKTKRHTSLSLFKRCFQVIILWLSLVAKIVD